MNLKRNILILAVVVIVMFGIRHVNADYTFGYATRLGWDVNLNWTIDISPNISADGLNLFFMSKRGDYGVKGNIMVTTRATKEDDWGRATSLRSINSSYYDDHPDISPDGLSLFFCSMRPGGYGNSDLWVTRRETKDGEWSTPVNLGPSVNSSDSDTAPCISVDGLSLFFDSDRSGGQGDSTNNKR